MSLLRRVIEKLQGAAGGAGGERARAEESAQPNEARFEPEEARAQKKPGDDLPMPEHARE
jgi:hypothetical protein